MISFITFQNAPEQLQIVADDQGLNELIDYLQYVKRTKDYIHLTIDTELNLYPHLIDGALSAKSITIEYSETKHWSI